MKQLLYLLYIAFFVVSLSYGSSNSNRVDVGGKDANVIEDPTQEELDDLADLMNWLNQFPVVTIDTNEIRLPSGRMWNEVNSKEIIEQFQRSSQKKEDSPKTKE